MLEHTLLSILRFCLYFGSALVALVIFKSVYTLITPQDEWKLIKEQRNVAAAIGLGGSVVGFSLALASAISNSVSLWDCITWAFVALLAQTFAFAIVRFIYMPKIVQRLEEGEVSAGVILASVSIAVGVLNAACMTY
ncbi:DUF350 domain-containing protein [Marinomonas gallaica]|uniref:DUF350 domain-containing protein n=1 Tax=Marinomonas gallaica TaxID=1806667 RepID=UPI003CE45DE7